MIRVKLTQSDNKIRPCFTYSVYAHQQWWAISFFSWKNSPTNNGLVGIASIHYRAKLMRPELLYVWIYLYFFHQFVQFIQYLYWSILYQIIWHQYLTVCGHYYNMTWLCPRFWLVERYGKIPVYMLVVLIITLCKQLLMNSLNKKIFVIKFVIINSNTIKIFCRARMKPWGGLSPQNHGNCLCIPWFVRCYSYNNLGHTFPCWGHELQTNGLVLAV